MSKKSASAVTVASKMVKGHKAPKLSNKAPASRSRKPVVTIVNEEPKSSKTLPPPAAAKRNSKAKPVASAHEALAAALAANGKAKAELAASKPAKSAVNKVTGPSADGTELHADVVRYFKALIKDGSSEAYAISLRRPLIAFTEWLDSRKLNISELEDKHLARYRAHVEALGRAISTTRMELARVQSFLRWAGCKADLLVLRVEHTKKEKQHLAELAEARAEVAS